MFAIVFVMIVIIPIAVGVPTMLVFIPPAMIVGVTRFAGFVQFVARIVGLPAVASMMLNGFVKTMIRLGHTALAIVIGAQTRSAREKQKTCHCRAGHRNFCCSKNSRLKFCLHPVLSSNLN